MASASLHQVGTSSSGSSSLRRFGTILRERAWLIVLCTLIGGGLAFAYLQYAPRNYAATATVEVSTSLARLLNLLSEKPIDTPQPLRQAQGNLKSRQLLQAVAVAQRLNEDPRFNGGATGEAAINRATEALQDRLQSATEGDDLLTITFAGPSPDLAARVANGVVEELLAQDARNRTQLLQEIDRLARKRLQDLQKELQPATTAPPGSVAAQVDPLAEKLRQLSEQIVTAELQQSQLEGDLKQADQQQLSPQALVQVPTISDQPGVKTARGVLLQKQVEFESVAQRYKEKHPDYVQAQAGVNAAQQTLTRETTAAIAQLRERLTTSQAALLDLKQQQQAVLAQIETLAQPSRTANEPPALSAPNAAALRNFTALVLERLQIFEFGPEAVLPPLQQKQPAIPPTEPLGPKPLQAAGLGLLGGLLVGLLMSLVFGYGDTSLRSVDEVEQVLGLPVLGVVPRLKGSDSELAAAEGFRSLRTSIAVSSRDHEPRLLQFTSTSPDEGKTFCALNFAVGLAQQGHQTVLIECDLRRPMAAPSLTLVKVDAPGVSDFLKSGGTKSGPAAPTAARPAADLSFAEIRKKKGLSPDAPKEPLAPGSGGIDFNDILQRTEVANLFFIGAGKPVANPTEMLARPRFEELLNQLLQRYDRIVLDSAPVLGVSETLLIASRMQAVCFVVRGSQTPRRAVLRAVEILRRGEIPLLGVVLNGITPKRSDPYGQDYYYHRTADR